jgi:NhaP-type Na+/H+ or K+/H+ antiporter
MAWEHLSINKPHLVYIVLGGFTTLFMLTSSVIKERLYIGEATVATLCGIIFGPHAANLINPGSWGNTDQITLEFARIVLVVQCFAVGVELPKSYMEKHWKSVVLLLVPVMTFGWLITSLFIWGLFTPYLSWLNSLAIAACVTATDPVLASSVVGKGKFAKRVPKHLRDLLSAESGCNDGMAFPFIYLALYIIQYSPHADEVALHWFGYTILYECIFGAVYGVIIGYAARRLIRYAHEKEMIDRESFLVFYFVLALFCAGSGSMLGLDDLLVGFAAGVGFSNDGWFTEKTEESHVSNVIDLLINLTFFVYFGTIIPWEQFNNGYYGMYAWKLVVLGILVVLFRRIPIMILLKPIIPDIKTWREALFAGHFGPIGVGAIFVAILARGELEHEDPTPLAELPPDTAPFSETIYLVWPIVCFLVIVSILVHGSSIAVFTLGKHINTLSLTMSYTQANDANHWTDRLPRIQSRSKTSMSMARSESSFDEKNTPMGQLPYGAPGTFLRRQKEEENPSRNQSRASSRHRSRRSRNWDSHGPGGPISRSAFGPSHRSASADPPRSRAGSDTPATKHEKQINDKGGASDDDKEDKEDAISPGEVYEEGHHTIFEDEDGTVLAVEPQHGRNGPDRETFERREGRRLMRRAHPNGGAPAETNSDDSKPGSSDDQSPKEEKPQEPKEVPVRPGNGWKASLNKIPTLGRFMSREDASKPTEKPAKKNVRGPARAYQYGKTIIVEDEEGEVIKKYDIPTSGRNAGNADPAKSQHRIGQMSKMLGLGAKPEDAQPGSSNVDATADHSNKPKPDNAEEDDDAQLRFTITTGGRRMSKAEFIDKIRMMDPRSRVEAVENSDAPEKVKREARKDYREQARASLSDDAKHKKSGSVPLVREKSPGAKAGDKANAALEPSSPSSDSGDEGDLNVVDSDKGVDVPLHDVSSSLREYQLRSGDDSDTAAERRRKQSRRNAPVNPDSEEEDEADPKASSSSKHAPPAPAEDGLNDGETAAERRRREGALGLRAEQDSDSEDDNEPRQPPSGAQRPQQPTNIRFADQTAAQNAGRQSALKWGKNVGR